jgi:hypothetical protein
MTRPNWVKIPYIGLTVAAALAAALPGFADPIVTLPSATSVAECVSVLGVVVDDPVSCSAGGGVAQVTLAPFAGVSTQATASADMSAGGFAALNYDFEIVGGNVGDVVPLLVTANLFTNVNSASDAFARIIVTTSVSSATVVACQNELACTLSDYSGSFGISGLRGRLTLSILRRFRGR